MKYSIKFLKNNRVLKELTYSFYMRGLVFYFLEELSKSVFIQQDRTPRPLDE